MCPIPSRAGTGGDRDQGRGAEFLRHPDDPGKYQIKRRSRFSPAAEVAGVIESVGAGVTDLKVGDRVVASCGHNGAREKIALRPIAL